MVKQSLFEMDKLMQIKKGFTLVESLFVLSVLTMFLLFGGQQVQFNPYFIDSTVQYANDIYFIQTKAMVDKETNTLKNTSFTFNAKGNINQAGTIHFDNYRCVFQLGAGRFYIE